MKASKVEFASNRKFGLFLTLGMLGAAVFLNGYHAPVYAWIVVTFSFIIFLITLLKEDLLLPLNRLWMRLGFMMGKIISPFTLGLLFYGLFTPVAFLMRIAGRDELRLKPSNTNIRWMRREVQIQSDSFKNQF